MLYTMYIYIYYVAGSLRKILFQGQCLINVGGDVVTVSYYADEKHGVISNC